MSTESIPSSATSPRQSWKRGVSLGLAVLTCPCHLPILFAVLAGTAVGGWLQQHTLIVSIGMVGVFVLVLGYSVVSLGREWAQSERLPPPESAAEPILADTGDGREGQPTRSG